MTKKPLSHSGQLLVGASLWVLTLSCTAAPTTYTDEVAKQERCKGDAELARSFFGAAPDAVKAAYADAKRRVQAKQLSGKKADDLRFLVYVGISASSGDEAYMKGWSACMDGKYDFK